MQSIEFDARGKVEIEDSQNVCVAVKIRYLSAYKLGLPKSQSCSDFQISHSFRKLSCNAIEVIKDIFL